MIQASSRQSTVNEQVWTQIGIVAEHMEDHDRAVSSYEAALKHNPFSLQALKQLSRLLKKRENYLYAAECYQRLLNLEATNGEYWSSLAHCYLSLDELQKAYSAFHQALCCLDQPRQHLETWYGIGLLYDKCGFPDHAEEAFLFVLSSHPPDRILTTVYYRLGIIYTQKEKYDAGLLCFKYILGRFYKIAPVKSVLLHVGIIYERTYRHLAAKKLYDLILSGSPDCVKTIQQLGWLVSLPGHAHNIDRSAELLQKAIDLNPEDSLSWHLLGRVHMASQQYVKAYEAYQQAVHRESRNPVYWFSIGYLYHQIHQYRDALDAYIRAIHINPQMNKVWWNLGILYESCNSQFKDALDAYRRALELDPHNQDIKNRIDRMTEQLSGTARESPDPPHPADIHPLAYPSKIQMFSGPGPAELGSRKHFIPYESDQAKSRPPLAERPNPERCKESGPDT